MHGHFCNALIFSYFLAGAMAAGCSTTDSTASVPEASTAARSGTGSEATGKATASELRQAQAPSSLEALRRGDPAVTAARSRLKDIHFGFDSFDLSPEARATLHGTAAWLRSNPAVRVEIEGHCDARGTNEYNLALGARRAQTAMDYLVSLGIAPDRLSTISYGEEIPVCRDANESCWQRNRRTRFVALAPSPGL